MNNIQQSIERATSAARNANTSAAEVHTSAVEGLDLALTNRDTRVFSALTVELANGGNANVTSALAAWCTKHTGYTYKTALGTEKTGQVIKVDSKSGEVRLADADTLKARDITPAKLAKMIDNAKASPYFRRTVQQASNDAKGAGEVVKYLKKVAESEGYTAGAQNLAARLYRNALATMAEFEQSGKMTNAERSEAIANVA